MPKRGYHHGNLRQALIDAALNLVEEKGPMGFTMADAAKHVGVSTAAPYRHFKSKEELIEETARQGFEIFADLMEYAYGSTDEASLAAFEATGRAYLAFARKYPGYYVSMFESGISLNASPELAHAAHRAKAVLHHAAEILIKRLPKHRRPPSVMVGDHIWAFSHGVVELYARGKPGNRSIYAAEDLLETGIGIYLRGLGILEPDT